MASAVACHGIEFSAQIGQSGLALRFLIASGLGLGKQCPLSSAKRKGADRDAPHFESASPERTLLASAS